jgi:hypothetical protein
LLGVIAALGGGLMGALLQNPVSHGSGCNPAVFATSLSGFWDLRLPR